MPLDNLEFQSPFTDIDRNAFFDRTQPTISPKFNRVWQQRFANLWAFIAPMNDIGNVVKFAGLPAKPLIGQRAWISDSTTNAWGGVAAGGGANQVGIIFNGVSWTVFAK